MQLLTKAEFDLKPEDFLKLLENNSIFIHPTDTIYGIGCDATNPKAVKKVRDIKKGFDRPFSVIVPSKRWIKENCIITPQVEEWLEKLPGPYTFIVQLKNKDAVCPEVNLGGNTLGIRIPDHWIAQLPRIGKVPIITTSANYPGQDYMTNLDLLDPKLKAKMDFIIYEGEKKGKPSTIVHLEQDKVKIRER